MTAREVAFTVLEAVDRGGYASVLLIESSLAADPRDAGLAAAITLGVLRTRGQLDYLITRYSGRTLEQLDPAVKNALRMAIFQLRYMDRIPAHAAVSESVELVKRSGKRSAAGFVNAVLRKVDSRAVEWPDSATELSMPEWMLERWIGALGWERAAGIAEAALQIPAVYVHVPAGLQPPAGARATDVPGCWEINSKDTGGYQIQDIGSQAIVPLLGVQAGDRVLDLCAAPGNKTAQLLELSDDVVAADISWKRLSGFASPQRVVLDARETLPFSRKFDRILVDAPCSGTGTLAHNPEIKWRLTPEQIANFPDRQRRILRSALAALAPGGTLVYSTCSLEPEENEEVTRAVAAGRIFEEVRRMPGHDLGDGFYAAVIR